MESILRDITERPDRSELQLTNAHAMWATLHKVQGTWLQAAHHWRMALGHARECGNVDHETSVLASLHRFQQTIPVLRDAYAPLATTTVELEDALRRLGREPDATCSICMEDLRLGDEAFALETCLHAFHGACIGKFWEGRGYRGLTTTNCPLCHQ